jgi:hypothetical protein
MSLIIKNVDKNGNDLPVRVYKDEKGKYSIAISKKVGEEYVNKYYPVEFLKDVSLENKTEIIIKHAFMTWFDWTFEEKTGTKFIIKIIAFDKVGETKQDEVTPQNINDKWEAAKNIKFEEQDELPFY